MQVKETKPDSRQLLLSVALDLFTRCGYDGTSIDQIRQAAGFKSKASLYTHFKSKEEVADALLTTILAGEEQLLQRAYQTSGEKPIEKFVAMGRAFIEWGLTHPQEYAFCFLQVQQESIIRGNQQFNTASGEMNSQILLMQLVGQLRPDYPVRKMSDLILTDMVSGLINKAVIDQAVFGPISLSEKIDQIMELCFGILFEQPVILS